MSAKLHFRNYIPKQMVFFPERLDKDIAPVFVMRYPNRV